MANTLINIARTKLTNGAHSEMDRKMTEKASANKVIRQNMANVLAEYERTTHAEEAVLVTPQGSQLTADKNEADKKCDSLWVAFKESVRAQQKFPEEDKREAADTVMRWIKAYKISGSLQIDKQVGLMLNFIYDCEGKLSGAILTLGLKQLLGAFKEAVLNLSDILSERDQDNGMKEKDAVAAARRAADQSWMRFRTTFNGYVYEHGDEGVMDFISFANGYMLRLKRDALKERASEPVAGEDGNPIVPPIDEPTDPDSPTNPDDEPETPGAGGDSETPPAGDSETPPAEEQQPQTYTLSFTHNGEVLHTYQYAEGQRVTTIPIAPEGYEWVGRPSTMPGHDVTVTTKWVGVFDPDL